MRLGMMALLGVGAAAFVLVAGCKKEDQAQNPNTPQGAYPQQQYPQQQYPQQQYPQGTYTPPAQTYPPPASTAPAPPGGLPCQTDNDPQCTFGHCLGGRCGGCSAPEHCKPGAACMQTPMGGACQPGGAPATQ